MVDPVRFPALSAYLERLPDGLDSYPECQAKGSMVGSALEGHDVAGALGELPETLAELVREPPPPTRWIPLACSESIFHLVCDLYYPREQDVIDWTYERTVAMAENPMYRRLASVAGPRFFLRIGASVHGLFERGTSMMVTSEQRTARVKLTHPPHVHSPLNKVSNVGMFRAIVRLTGAKHGTCKMSHCNATGAVFDCTWD